MGKSDQFTEDQFLEVYNKRQSYMKRASRWGMSDDIRTVIRRAMRKGYTVEDLCVLIEYTFTADEPFPKFWRGGNDAGTKYLSLDQIFRVTKLRGRLELAWDWKDGDAGEDTTMNLGIVGRLRAQLAGT